jgi:uncharacterized protein (TIGR02217 family)
MAIPAYRLPPEIERGAVGGPEFRTVIQESVSGKEQRIIQWADCRARFDIAYSVMNSADPLGNYLKVQALFYGHRGKAHPFRFKAWSDYTATDENFGHGDGATVAFQLTKTYDPGQLLLGSPGAFTYTRDIVKVVGTPVIKIGGVPTTDFTLSSVGVVTFNSAPDTVDVLTWTGEFDLPVRFDTDYLPVVMSESDLVSINSIPIREVIGEA